MLSKAQNKYIRSLTQQKYRKEYKAFIAEGDKIAREWLRSDVNIQMIIAAEEWAGSYEDLAVRHPETTLHIVKEHELAALSTLSTPNKILLVVSIPNELPTPPDNEWCILLDDVQDPGNVGTIIRIADWFGIRHLICSPGCADVYGPKVVQAAMGSHLHVNLHRAEPNAFLSSTKLPIFAATLDGENIYKVKKPKAGVLVIGNESKGISDTVLAAASHTITIPRTGQADSLNAAVSAGIICSLLVQS